ncbi:MAG: c-type cytochrome [Candidatus Brocadiae bacterium]|nr:c-type cytochrome [Candidatus Brocadiia bacterium]
MITGKHLWKLSLSSVVAAAATGLLFSGCSGTDENGNGNGNGGGAPPAAIGEGDGKTLFAANCAVCHGPEGRGDGTASYLLWPRPRDFSAGKFKIRSTKTGGLPTDDDLFNVISNGMPGTSMPAWSHFPEDARRRLVAVVKALSQYRDADMDAPFNHFASKGAGEVVTVPAEPAVTAATLARGKTLYVDQGCVKCHGETGRADGPSARDLKDDWEQPIRPNDFTQGIFRGGSTSRDIYLRFATGMSGTPMPAYTEMPDADRWALVHYVLSLSGEGSKQVAAATPTGSLIEVASVGKAPVDPADPAWDMVKPVTIPLALLFNRSTAPRLADVRVVHDGTNVAFQISWEDSSNQSAVLRAEDFRDAVALQFALKGLDTPFTMGSADKPVNIWHWKADWQVDLGRWQDVEQAHPGMAVEMYPYEKGDRTVVNKGGNPPPMPEQDKAFQSGWAAGNAMSNPQRTSAAEECVAAGFGTLTSLPSDRQKVSGKGIWKAGRWTVVMSRPVAGPDACCVTFRKGVEVPVSFAVWDGAAGDRAGQKSVTTWYRLVLK